MMIASWTIDARFGQKQAVIGSTKKWCRGIGAQIVGNATTGCDLVPNQSCGAA